MAKEYRVGNFSARAARYVALNGSTTKKEEATLFSFEQANAIIDTVFEMTCGEWEMEAAEKELDYSDYSTDNMEEIARRIRVENARNAAL